MYQFSVLYSCSLSTFSLNTQVQQLDYLFDVIIIIISGVQTFGDTGVSSLIWLMTGIISLIFFYIYMNMINSLIWIYNRD